jgi:branched-chain amino acid transport system permease protein
LTAVLAADWAGVAQQIVAGLSSGGTYAMLAVALVLIHRSTGVVNFAQGEMAMVSTFVAWTLTEHGLSYWEAFALSVAASFAAGIVLERVLIRPVERAPVLTVAIVTIGLFFLCNGAAFWIWSPEVKSMPSAFSTRPVHLGGVAFSIADLGTIAVSLLAVLLLWAFFRFTKLGLAMRAAALNPDSSRLTGIRVSWTIALGWGLAAALGAVAGLMAAPPLGSFDQNFMQPVLLFAFAGAILGGIDSALGAVVGSLLLGVFLNLIGTYVSWVGTDLRQPAALAVILGVLLVRPAGLFGRVTARRV